MSVGNVVKDHFVCHPVNRQYVRSVQTHGSFSPQLAECVHCHFLTKCPSCFAGGDSGCRMEMEMSADCII